MEDIHKARTISGEIVAPETRNRAARAFRADMDADVLDAEFEAIPADMRQKMDSDSGTVLGPASVPITGLDSLRQGGRDTLRSRGKRGGPLFWLAGCLLVATAFWISGGHVLIEGQRGASAIPGGVLRLADVNSHIEKTGGKTMLIVDGTAVNDGPGVAEIPVISIAVLGWNGTTTRFFLGSGVRGLPPGAHFPFSGRLATPDHGAKTVTVSFAPHAGANP